MSLCVEAYFIVNLLMDLAVYRACARLCGRIYPRRVWAASLLGAAWACAMYLSPFPFARVATALVALLLTRLACPPDAALRDRFAALTVSLFASGGALALFRRASGAWTGGALALGAAAAYCLMPRLLGARARSLAALRLTVYIRSAGKSVLLAALVDTGNRLREPISGLPVLIAEETRLKPLLPPRGARLVRYGAVGGAGEMPCFLPDAVYVRARGVWSRAPDVYVAAYPGRLPGGVRALAPFEMGALPLAPTS